MAGATAANSGRIRIALPEPHAGQVAVRAGARRFNWLSAGRRWRKTTLCMAIAVENAWRGREILWGAPTYDQVRVGWDETRRAAAGSRAITFNASRMEAAFAGGGIIRYRSLDNPQHARGHTADGVVIDEAASVSPEAWYDAIRPILMSTNGWAWVIGTPMGRNWFHKEWALAHTGEEDDSAAWQAPALGCAIQGDELVRMPHPLENPELPWSEILKLYRTMPERSFMQEILAEFIDDAGGVFRGVRKAAVLAPTHPEPERIYIGGIDWGRSEDFTVICVLDATERPVRQVLCERSNQVSWQMLLDRARAVMERYQPVTVYAEANAMGEPLIEQLQADGFPVAAFVTTSGTKQAAIDALALAFEQDAVLLLRDEVQTAELEAYTMERLPSGRYRYSAPEGLHDDTVMALALAWQGAKADYNWAEEPEDEDLTPEEAYNAAMRRLAPEPRHGTGWGVMRD